MDNKKDIIKLQSKKQSELSTKFTSGNQQYFVITEIEKQAPLSIKTKVYLEGMVIDIVKSSPLSKEGYILQKELEKQHNRVVEQVKQKRPRLTDKVDYFRKIKAALNRDSLEEALHITEEAIEHYQNEPLLLSYYGYLIALVKKDYDMAEELCKQAINRTITGTDRDELQMLLPTLYLNLGRVYLLSDMKGRAIENFRRGLRVDPEYKELINELNSLGVRRKPILPFLPRSNPINKYLGLFLSKLKK